MIKHPPIIKEIYPNQLALYASIPIVFEVRSIFRVDLIDSGLGGMRFIEKPVKTPYIKDYDSYGESLLDWQRLFDMTYWGCFLAFDGKQAIGGAAVAFKTDGVDMLDGRDDLAVLWDIRVHPRHQGKGIGKALFHHAADWARERGCTQLKIETQNVNVPACRFYVSQGCKLGGINRYGYYGHPQTGDEVMLLWYLDLSS
jgi:GNAT superfamily N-acetyltransferase